MLMQALALSGALAVVGDPPAPTGPDYGRMSVTDAWIESERLLGERMRNAHLARAISRRPEVQAAWRANPRGLTLEAFTLQWMATSGYSVGQPWAYRAGVPAAGAPPPRPR